MKKDTKKSRSLFEGVKEFKEKDYVLHQDIFKNLEKNQNPHTLFIGCSDSRVVPNLITKSLPGELFIIRNVANLVPFYRENVDAYLATSAAIEYAVQVLNVENIIICGHSNCGGCRALYSSESKLKSLPMTKKWLELAHPVKALVKEKIKAEKPDSCKRDEFTAQLNVVEQMKHLLTFPYIKERQDKGDLNILGWYYVIETGEVFNYSPAENTFIRIE